MAYYNNNGKPFGYYQQPNRNRYHRRNQNQQQQQQQQQPQPLPPQVPVVPVVQNRSAQQVRYVPAQAPPPPPPAPKTYAETQKEQEFSNILECPVCFTIPDNEIFNCEAGHSVCGNCRGKMTQCAFCARPYTRARNYVMESMVSHFKKFGMPIEEKTSKATTALYCENKMEGCTRTELERSKLVVHEKECEYRPVRCKATAQPKCPWDTYLKLSEYLSHLLSKHSIKGLSEPSGYFTKIDRLFMGLEVNSTWPPFYLNFDGRTFLRFATIQNRKLSWWVQLVGPDSHCKQYRAVISIHAPAKPDSKISWSVPVHAIRSNQANIEHENIAVLSSEQLHRFCTTDEQFEDRVATHVWICNIVLNRVG